MKKIGYIIIGCIVLGACSKLENALDHIGLDMVRFHYPVNLAIYGSNSLLTANDNQGFDFKIVEREGIDCIINAAGTNEFKIIDQLSGNDTRSLFIFGVNQACDISENNPHPMGIITENKNLDKDYFTAYKYIVVEGEDDPPVEYQSSQQLNSSVELVTYGNHPNQNIYKYDTIFERSSTLQPISFYPNGQEVTIEFPDDQRFQDKHGELISFGLSNRDYKAYLTLIDDNVQSSSVFPVPPIADDFSFENGFPAPRIAAFIPDTDYIGLELRYTPNGKKVARTDNENLLKINYQTQAPSGTLLRVWRFFETDGVFRWQEVGDFEVDSVGYLHFESPFSYGWTVSGNLPIPSCNPQDLYATVNVNLMGTGFPTTNVADLFTVELLDENNQLINWASINASASAFKIYGVGDVPTTLNLYRKNGCNPTQNQLIDSKPLSGCSTIDWDVTLNETLTRVSINIKDARCDKFPIDIDKKGNLWAMCAENSTLIPSVADSNWFYVGFMQNGYFETYSLKQDSTYWMMVTAPEYGTAQVFTKPLTVGTSGINPIVPTTNNNGQFVCTNNECSLVITNQVPLETLFAEGDEFCDLLFNVFFK